MRDPSRSPQLAEIAKRERLPIKVSAMDVDSDASVRESIAAIHKTQGPLNVLVNNAGIERRGSVEELDISEFRAVMETNFFGALRCIQAVLPEMRGRRSGCIVNITSVGGRISSPPLTVYSASKYALEALSEGLAAEAKMFNIRVAIVEPGVINTDMAKRQLEPLPPSLYPHARRMAALFAASLQRPTPPEVVGEMIRDIIESDTWKLRHPAGPDAEGYLQWRASMTDEQWVDQNACDDETWYRQMEQAFGISLR
jgi:NAD(P)-dependent dehydrogenase (short-subunit alcohol dehydrogenase family)